MPDVAKRERNRKPRIAAAVAAGKRAFDASALSGNQHRPAFTIAHNPRARKTRMPNDSPEYRPCPRFPELGDGFFDPVAAPPFPKQIIRHRNHRWAERVGLGDLSDEQWIDHFCRFEPLPGNLPEPLALRYHGHQFRNYNPQLGDGRGFLFAQLLDANDRLLDLGTKGSGPTPWSRGGDGRLTLKGGVREVLATELLEALGVYTSKTFSLIETGEELYRGDEPSPTRSAVMVRLSHSHVRFGSFQRHAYAKDATRIQALVDYCIANFMPDLMALEGEDRIAAFLSEVCLRGAQLAASWQLAGFVHGVLNTDNMNITGESFDYGPYRFLPTFDPSFVAAYFDTSGLYSFGRQPATVAWNLARLAETLTLVCSEQPLADALGTYDREFRESLEQRLLIRLNLRAPADGNATAALVEAIYEFLADTAGDNVTTTAQIADAKGELVGYERFFFDWFGGLASAERRAVSPCAQVYAGQRARRLQEVFAAFEPADATRMDHVYFRNGTPCTLLIDEIESIWSAISESDDWTPLEQKLAAIAVMKSGTGTE
ncbi:MAG: hypothetical protein ACI91F_001199 [Candidatus Binatia bacterium]